MSSKFSLLPHRSVISVAGADRVEFLQGLISNDTRKVAPGHAVWAALLTPQGRFLNDMFVVDAGQDVFYLETERERAPALARKLKMYTLRSKVVVEDRSAALEVAAVFGDDASRALGLENAVTFADPRLPTLGVRVIAAAGQAATLLSARGLSEAPLVAYDALRLPLGVPDGSRDLQVEKALLLENGFDELNGVDWKKGCYMGQELTARTKYRALIKKRLFPVRVEGTLPEAGTPVHQNGEEVGEVRSGMGDRALAMLKLEAARTGPLTAGDARIVPEIPTWMRLPENPSP
ncbi:folate-binding protein [Reyranella aquatilis]|uniref:Folate-binding protein n=1 Tax=Reyranella aquatilis TaxID=2035356 RepID=A0ABS8KR35_9HYPH|nr:folate-binding protein [Reyranella aquatilis]MCC8428535.1 folate-binding protein [Reyranella aquatilis]